MKILFKYLTKEVALYFFLSLFAFTGILLTMRLISFASLVINKGVEVHHIVAIFISIIPTFLEIAIPLATLLGVMLAFGRLSGDSEIVVIRASGISLSKLTIPALVFGITAALCTLYVTLSLSPKGYQKLNKTFFDIARSKSSAGLDQGIFNKLGGLTLYAETIEHESGTLHAVLIDDQRNEESRKVVIATDGMILSDEAKQQVIIHLTDGYIHEIIRGNYNVTYFTSNNIVMSANELNDPKLSKKNPQVREMYLPDIRNEISKKEELLSQAPIVEIGPMPLIVAPPELDPSKPAPETTVADLKKRIYGLKIEAARRFAMPFSTFILALVGLPLGIYHPRTQRTWGVGLSAALGMAVFVCYYGLLSVGITLGEGGKLNPYMAVWLPNFVCSLIAIYILKKITYEEWQSINQGLEDIFAFINNKASRILRNR